MRTSKFATLYLVCLLLLTLTTAADPNCAHPNSSKCTQCRANHTLHEDKCIPDSTPSEE